jgi:hypothetical protein
MEDFPVERKYDIEHPMPPLWLKYPHIERGRIGWRMGGGEDYLHKFMRWFSSLTAEEQKKYQAMFPEPRTWLGWYSGKHISFFSDGVFHWRKNDA